MPSHPPRPGFRSAKIFLLLLTAAFATALFYSARGLGAKLSSNNRAVVIYTNDEAIFPNPERGFYVGYEPTNGGTVGQQDTPHPPLMASELKALRQRPEGISLIRDDILIPRKFWTRPISKEYLSELESNFDAVRAAGLKTVPRLLYDWSMQNRDPGEAVINRHLDQLKPLLQKNADIIAWMQGGLFGGTGEGNASDHGYVYPKYFLKGSPIKWQGLSPAGQRLLLRELQVLPRERMLNMRYPRLKWDLFSWSPPSAMRKALTPATAFNGSDEARVGFYNDGFMGDEQHYAMFQLPNEGNFTAQDTGFVVHEGEVSDVGEYKLKARQVVLDMERYHMTALHLGGDGWPEISSAWKRNGDYEQVVRRMGYRFRLVQAGLPQSLRAGNAFVLDLKMANDGFARAMNPRGFEVVLRNKQSGASYWTAVQTKDGNRLWLPGPGEEKALRVETGIPTQMPAGEYEVLLHLPDPQKALYGLPGYSIRLANKGLWEGETGYNRMLHTLRIGATGGTKYVGRSFFTLR